MQLSTVFEVFAPSKMRSACNAAPFIRIGCSRVKSVSGQLSLEKRSNWSRYRKAREGGHLSRRLRRRRGGRNRWWHHRGMDPKDAFLGRETKSARMGMDGAHFLHVIDRCEEVLRRNTNIMSGKKGEAHVHFGYGLGCNFQLPKKAPFRHGGGVFLFVHRFVSHYRRLVSR